MAGLLGFFRKKFEAIERRRELEKRTARTIARGDTRVYFGQDAVRLFFRDCELTKHAGIACYFLSEARWQGAEGLPSEVEKLSDCHLRSIIQHPGSGPLQEWSVSIEPDGAILFDVSIKLHEAARIDRVKVDIFLPRAYTRCIEEFNSRLFPEGFEGSWQAVSSANGKDATIECISSDPRYPGLAVSASGGVKTTLNAGNTDALISSRFIEASISLDSEYLQPGAIEHLKLRIQLYPDGSVLEDGLQKRKQEKEAQEQRLRQEQEQEDLARRTIEQADFRLFLNQNNSLSIFYKDTEITKCCGLQTNVLSQGVWYSHADSQVEIERPGPAEMLIRFHHRRLPLVTTWQCRLSSQGVLEWNAGVAITASLRLDRRNASLMVSKAYVQWSAFPQKGMFPEMFSGQWQGMNNPQESPDFIALLPSSGQLPGIVFKDMHEPRSLLLVQNTDASLSSRVLEAQAEEASEQQEPGTYEHFKILIQLYPDKSVLEEILEKMHKEREDAQRKARQLKEEEEKKRMQQLKEEEEREKKRQEEEERKRKTERDIREQILTHFKESAAPAAIAKEGDVLVFGHAQELHDKISGQPGDFLKIAERMRSLREKATIKIGVSRYNFFALHTVAQYCAQLINKRLDLRALALPVFPVRSLFDNFGDYLQELNLRLQRHNIYFFLKDPGLPLLLRTVSSQADQYNERDLLRLLSIIAEHPFIGPQTIVLDTYHRCNTNCMHCWIHTPKRKETGKTEELKMEIEVFKGIIDDAARLLSDEIIIQGDGEPTLDPRFMEMITYARDKGLKVLFFTNGTLLDKEKARKIIDLEVNEIFCSLPAGTARTYCAINPGHKEETFHAIVANLKELIAMRNKGGRNKPLVQMTHVIHNMNYHELEEMARLDAAIGADKVRFYLVRLDENIRSLKLGAEHARSMEKSLERIEPFLREKGIDLQDNIRFQLAHYDLRTGDWSGQDFLRGGCPVGWFFALILSKGEVSMCCHLRIVDILNGKKFGQVWESEQYNQVRIYAKHLSQHQDARLLGGSKLYDDFCKHCDTHQVILRINAMMQQYNLEAFYREA